MLEGRGCDLARHGPGRVVVAGSGGLGVVPWGELQH